VTASGAAGWPYPALIAHRGGGALAPENTLAAIREGHARGYRMVEFDAMLSRDGVPLLIHDETLERTTDGRGRVCDHTAAELQRLDAGAWFHARFKGEAVPTLAQAAALCRVLGLAANVEIKPAAGTDAETGRAVAAACAVLWAGAEVPPLLSSFSSVALMEARFAAPHLPRGLLFDDPPADWLGQLRRLDGRALHCNARHLRDETLAAARAAGVPVLCYTVNDPAEAQDLLARGVAGVFTDRLDLIH